jgi:hypothetical protein
MSLKAAHKTTAPTDMVFGRHSRLSENAILDDCAQGRSLVPFEDGGTTRTSDLDRKRLPSIFLRAYFIAVSLPCPISIRTSRRSAETTHLAQRLPQLRYPVIKRVEKVVSSRIRGRTFKQPLAPAVAQELVDKRWDLLVRLHPVVMPAPEDGKPNVGELALLCTLERLHESTGVVGGLSFVRSREDDHRTVGWDLRFDRVERDDAGIEA